MQFEVPNLKPEGCTLQPNTRFNGYRFGKPVWDLDQFNKSHKPEVIGCIQNKNTFSSYSVRVLDMPIRFPGTEYRLPLELVKYREVIQQIIDYEHANNPYIDDYFAYLTIDSSVVVKGTTQRQGGCHADGFQGARIKRKTLINRSYIVADRDTTEFYCHPFSIRDLDDAKHDFFLDFDLQADLRYVVRPEPYQVVFMNAYQVHKAVPATQTARRTFLRLSFDVKEFDRLGNTHNPLFDYNWNMVARNAKSTLTIYER